MRQRSRENLCYDRRIPALQALEQIVALPGIDECFIGINDLHIALGQRFMFELLGDGTLDRIARCMHKHQMPFGFGGIAKMGEGTLPSTALLGEHLRLGSSSVIYRVRSAAVRRKRHRHVKKFQWKIEKIRAGDNAVFPIGMRRHLNKIICLSKIRFDVFCAQCRYFYIRSFIISFMTKQVSLGGNMGVFI